MALMAVLWAAILPSPLAARARTLGQGPLVHLPGDQSAHPGAANEWWYVVGHVRSGARTFGYEVTIFHISHLRPPGFTTTLDLYRTDVAITDEMGHRFYHQITPYFPQSAAVSTRTLSVRVGHASLVGSSPANMTLIASMSTGSLRLKLSSRRPPLAVGGRGYLAFGGGYTYYYSLTDVATSGVLRIGKRSYRTAGLSWLDHQWGNWSWATVSGWTWTCVQLDNGMRINAFDFRGYGRRTRQANILFGNGRFLLEPDVRFTPTGTWRSPHTAGQYPASVTLDAPALQLKIRVQPTVADQEMVWSQEKRGSYWEGSSRVTGTLAGRRVSGVAYLELTGYARG